MIIFRNDNEVKACFNNKHCVITLTLSLPTCLMMASRSSLTSRMWAWKPRALLYPSRHITSAENTLKSYLKSSYYFYLVPKTGKTIVDLFFCSLPGLCIEVSLVGGCVLTLRDIKDDRQSNVSVSHCEWGEGEFVRKCPMSSMSARRQNPCAATYSQMHLIVCTFYKDKKCRIRYLQNLCQLCQSILWIPRLAISQFS